MFYLPSAMHPRRHRAIDAPKATRHRGNAGRASRVERTVGRSAARPVVRDAPSSPPAIEGTMSLTRRVSTAARRTHPGRQLRFGRCVRGAALVASLPALGHAQDRACEAPAPFVDSTMQRIVDATNVGTFVVVDRLIDSLTGGRQLPA